MGNKSRGFEKQNATRNRLEKRNITTTPYNDGTKGKKLHDDRPKNCCTYCYLLENQSHIAEEISPFALSDLVRNDKEMEGKKGTPCLDF